jgi:hypothetical protein
MRTLQRGSLIAAALFVISACLLPTAAATHQGAQATSMARTVVAIVIQTQGAAAVAPFRTGTPSGASPTVTATPIPSSTQTLSSLSTPVVVSSLTSLVPLISVSVPTNCRVGPGTAYDISGALLTGQSVEIFARDPSGMFWYIRNPNSEGDFCWVWGGYATLTGLTEALPIYTPLPTPTASNTPTPTPAFDLSYEGLVSCTGAWWPRLRLKNSGMITFRSLGIIVKDTVNDTTVADLTDSFIDRTDCSSTVSRSTLLPGKAATISPPAFDQDPGGHKLRATITLCSETGQQGTCITENITFRP